MSGLSFAAIETAINKVMVDQCSPTASLQTSVLDAQDSDYERPKRTLVLENFMPLKRRWEKQLKEKIFQNDAGNNSQQHEDKVVIGRPAWMKETQLWTKQSESIDYEVFFFLSQTCFLVFGIASFSTCAMKAWSGLKTCAVTRSIVNFFCLYVS